MTLLQGRRRDLHELAGVLQLLDVAGAAESHAGADAAEQLEDRVLDRALVGDAAFDAFRHQFLRVLLEVAVLAALLHRADGAHAAVDLVLSALVELEFSRALVAAGEDRTHHADVAARRQGLGHIAGVLDAAVRDDRDAVLLRDFIGIHDRADLGDAAAGDDARRADRSGADADLDRVRARFDQGSRAFARRDVAADDVEVRELLLDHAHAAQHVLRVAVRGVEHDDVDVRVHQLLHSLEHVRADADAGAAQKPSLRILRGERVLDRLLNVFDRDEADQVVVLIDDRELLFAGGAEDLLCFLERHAFFCRDQVLAGHRFGDLSGKVLLELHIAVRDDTDELLSLGDGNAGDAVLLHQLFRVRQRVLRGEGERVGDDAVFGAFYFVHFFCLRFDRHVLVDHADAALPRHCDGHAALRDGVHTGAHHGDVKYDFLRQVGRQIDLARDDRRVGRHEEDVVKGKAVSDDRSHSYLLSNREIRVGSLAGGPGRDQ